MILRCLVEAAVGFRFQYLAVPGCPALAPGGRFHGPQVCFLAVAVWWLPARDVGPQLGDRSGDVRGPGPGCGDAQAQAATARASFPVVENRRSRSRFRFPGSEWGGPGRVSGPRWSARRLSPPARSRSGSERSCGAEVAQPGVLGCGSGPQALSICKPATLTSHWRKPRLSAQLSSSVRA
jgi:hypothetical protein